MENYEIFDAGAELARASKGMLIQPRGLVEELFPFLYEASRRMSARAISRWLESERGIRLSAVSISKALRNSESHWQDFGDDIQVAAGVIEDAWGVKMEDFLFDETIFDHILSRDPTELEFNSPEEFDELRSQVQEAGDTINKRWFRLDSSTRSRAVDYVSSRNEADTVDGDDDRGQE